MLAAHPSLGSADASLAPSSKPHTLEGHMAKGTLRRLETKEDLYCEGDPRTHVFRVEQGVIAIYKTLVDGRRRIIDFAYPGDLVGLGVLKEHILSAQAVCSSKVRCLSAAALEREAERDADIAIKLYNAVCQELAAARELLVTIGQASAVEKVATFLLKLNRRSRAPGNVVRLDMRRADIGDLLGLTIETVSRTLTKLRAMGVIELGNGGATVRLCDLERLEALANG